MISGSCFLFNRYQAKIVSKTLIPMFFFTFYFYDINVPSKSYKQKKF
jgi:hypothetical protein